MSNLQVLQKSLANEGIRTQFRNALQEGAQSFAASLAELYANDGSLRECDPNLVILEAMKAASLQLPISKGLGFAYLVPFRDKNRNGAKVPQLQIVSKATCSWPSAPAATVTLTPMWCTKVNLKGKTS